MTTSQNLLAQTKINSIITPNHPFIKKKITHILKIRRDPILSLPFNRAKVFRGQNSESNRRALKIVYVSEGQDSGDSGGALLLLRRCHKSPPHSATEHHDVTGDGFCISAYIRRSSSTYNGKKAASPSVLL